MAVAASAVGDGDVRTGDLRHRPRSRLDIALHTNPQLRAVIQPQSQKQTVHRTRCRPARKIRRGNRPSGRSCRRWSGDAIVLTAETINALIAYRDDPSPARRQELLAALARAGAPPIAADGVRAIVVQPPLYERLTQRTGGLPTRITARPSMSGELIVRSRTDRGEGRAAKWAVQPPWIGSSAPVIDAAASTQRISPVPRPGPPWTNSLSAAPPTAHRE